MLSRLSSFLKQPVNWFIPLILIAFYLISHLANLTTLPVFADESIYIRWTQLMIDDFGRYALFPLNDGKTPLQMWLMIPFQFIFSDQLYAGRFLSVLVGLGQMLVNGYLVHQLGGRKKAVWLSMLLTAVLPYWYFHHRMALIDGLLTLWLSLAMVGLVQLSQLMTEGKRFTLVPNRTQLMVMTFSGVMFGLALLTKLTAVLFLPAFALLCCLPEKMDLKRHFKLLVMIGFSSAIGLALFGLLKLHPAFGQLFSRGGDFLFPWRQVILEGKWTETLRNTPSYVSYFVNYFSLPLTVLAIGSLFAAKRQRTYHVLFWSAVICILPIVLLGKVVYARYLFSAVVYLTVGVSLFIQDLVDRWISHNPILWQKAGLTVALFLLISNTLAMSLMFMSYAITKPNQIPFVPSDRTQYLTEWSSGHGIKETVDFIQAEAQKQPTAVATEGFFGTLPDGVVMYLHRRNVDNLYVDGIGQPVGGIPDSFKAKARNYEKTYLVVNSHRMKMKLSPDLLVRQYCRPYQAPCLQIWDVTAVVKLGK